MKKVYLLSMLLCMCFAAGAQTRVFIYACAPIGSYTTGTAIYTPGTPATYVKDDRLIAATTTASGGINEQRGWAVFDLSVIPAGATVSSVSLCYNLQGFTTGVFGNCVTHGIPGDISGTLPAVNMYNALIGGTTLWTGTTSGVSPSYGPVPATTVGNDSLTSIGAAAAPNNFISTNGGTKVTISFTGGGSDVFNITGEDGSCAPTLLGPVAPYLDIVYCFPPTGVTASVAPSPICAGQTFSLTGSAVGASSYQWNGPGGYFSTSLNSTASATFTSGGVYTLTAMASCGTFSATTKAVTGTLTINASPAALITPTTTVCVGSSIYLSDVTAGGVWTSSNTNMATVDAQGHVFAVSAGSPVISYTLGICAATAIVKVNAPPGPIFGPSSEVCQSGGLLSLGDPIAGGTWSSSATAQATVDPVSGVVTAVAPGVTNINYFTGACPTVTYSVTVDPLPSVITGVNAVCENATIFLSDVTANGTWSSSNTNLATVDPNTGKVSGVSAASVTISYILPTGCFVTKAITVNPAPSVILGSAAVCEGSTIRLSDATAGGTWSSANSSRAAIGSLTGIVTGNTAGSVNISYSVPVTQCFAILPLTVAPVPTAITGNNSVCKGAQGYLSDAVGGGDWSSQTTTVATIDPVSGTVYGVTAGSDVITYMIGGTGCKVVYTYSVNPLPTAVITAGGPTTFCPGPGGSVTLTAGPAGMTYQWYSNGNPVATGSTYTSTSTELITLQVTDGNGCSNTTSPGTQVTLIPNITISAAGPTVFCQPYNVLLSVPLAVGLQYQWKLNGVNIPGANSNTYYASQGGTYTDSVWVPGGCSVVTPPFTVIVHPMPTPVVFYTGTQLVTATGFITYQWFLNSIAIPGATTNAVTPLVNGTYIIRVVDGNGCMGYSNGFAMNNLGVEILTNTDIKIYPNPANSLVHIESPVNVRAVITGMEGQTVMEVNNAAEVNISKLPDGLYMILLYDKKGDRLLVQKLIKE